MFKPLAYTKTYAMAAAALLAVTLVPVLMGYVIRGRIPGENANPLNRWLIAGYRPQLRWALRWPKATLAIAALVLAATAYPVMQLGGEFMPPLDEGDLLYMPTALPGLSAGKAAELLQQTDRMIRTGARGGARVRQDRPRRDGDRSGAARDDRDDDPVQAEERVASRHDDGQARSRSSTAPCACRDCRTSGCRRSATASTCSPPASRARSASRSRAPISPRSNSVTQAIERAAKGVPGVTSALAERLEGGRYLDVTIDRAAAARYGLNVADIQDVIAAAVGGENIGETVEGLARFPISVRYPRELRDSVDALRMLPIVTEMGAQIPLAAVASVRIVDGPPMLRSENARLSGWVYVDARGRDLVSVVRDLQAAVARDVKLPPGYSRIVVGPVRVSRTREGAARVRRAVHAARHLRAALSRVPPPRRSAHDHARRAVRAGRRLLAAVAARLLDVGRDRGRLHRARRRCRRIRRRHADLPAQCVGSAPRRGAPATRGRRSSPRSRRARCCACGRRR